MQFEEFGTKLKERLLFPLPGSTAHTRMASPIRLKEMVEKLKAENPKESGVLILLYPDRDHIMMVLIKRTPDGGVHSGQVAFPGGRYEDGDQSLTETALREAREEIGLDPALLEMTGFLSTLYIPPSNFNVLPVVALCRTKPLLKADPKEVETIIEIPLDEFYKEHNRKNKEINVRGITLPVPCYEINGVTIWGATAMIISELLEVLPDYNTPSL